MTFNRVSSLLIFTAASLSCAWAQEAPIEIRSGENRLAFDPTTGRMSVLTLGDRNLVTAPKPSRKPHGVLPELDDIDGPGGLFRMHAPLPEFEAHLVDAANSRPAIERTSDGLRLKFSSLLSRGEATGISAIVQVVAVGDGSFKLSLTVKNGSRHPVPQVFFPRIVGLAPIDGASDQVVFGKRSFKPWQEFNALRDSEKPLFRKYLASPEHDQPYPSGYGPGMKWMDFCGRDAGLTLYSEETTAQTQFLQVSAETYAPSTINLGWYFYPFIPAGGTWSSPTFVVYPHRGDWHRGVLKFKEFADRAFTPVASTPARDETIGQFSLWMSWHYQDWSRVRYRFTDIPEFAAEARRAGFREMTVARGTALDFQLPPVVRAPLGTDAELKDAVEQSRRLGVNVIPFFTCRVIRPETVPAAERDEWFVKNVAGQFEGGNYTYHPTMTPQRVIRQIGSRAGYFACAGSEGWRTAYRAAVEDLPRRWGFHGIFFDQSMAVAGGLCFNPLHTHPVPAEGALVSEVLDETRRSFAARFPDAVVTGEGQWDVATQWMDYTWDWAEFKAAAEEMAPFHMAFPKARTCAKAADDRSVINRIFAAGYWIDLYLEDGGARLRDYPELAAYLATLAKFKKRFVDFLGRRDAYLHDMFVQAQPAAGVWARVHRSGNEALVMLTHANGKAAECDVTLDVQGILGRAGQQATLWSRELKELSALPATDRTKLRVRIPAEDFVAIHLK